MTKQDAIQAIGQPIKINLSDVRGGMVNMFDTIRKVSYEGVITGDFIEVDCTNARLKYDQPDHLKKSSG